MFLDDNTVLFTVGNGNPFEGAYYSGVLVLSCDGKLNLRYPPYEDSIQIESYNGSTILAAVEDGAISGNPYKLAEDFQTKEIVIDMDIKDIKLSLNGKYFITFAAGSYSYDRKAVFSVFDYYTEDMIYQIEQEFANYPSIEKITVSTDGEKIAFTYENSVTILSRKP